jgi:sec-independent protein translocase protein TatC
VAFYAGAGFSYFFVLPFALNFLIAYGVNAGFVPQISIAQYVGFALWFLMVFGLTFEVPLALTLMAKLGWVDAPFLIQYWKWALLGSFVIAAILTPTPDPFNQTLMAGPMFLLYWVGIFGAKLFGKKTASDTSQSGVPTVAMAGAGGSASGVSMGKSSDDEYVGVPGGRGH